MQPESISLFFRNDKSDKVYHASLEAEGDGYIVNFSFGRRGSTLQAGTKTSSPIDYASAKKIYDKLISEKTAKGYSPDTTGIPFLTSDKAERISGVQCQLLNAIDESEFANYIADANWCFQEKMDGKRMLVRRNADGTIEAINRKGLIVVLPAEFENSLAGIKEEFILDGEAVGDKLYLFDMLNHCGEDIRARQYRDRLNYLGRIKDRLIGKHVEIVETALQDQEKAALAAKLQQQKREGIVIKYLAAPYAAGRPASGGHQLKYKFTESLSAIVVKVNDKRSVKIGLLNDQNEIVDAGNVTILPNFPMPAVGAIIEVRYLYAHAQTGVLYQPLYLGSRDDIDRSDCRTSQLKLKAGKEDDES